MSKIMAPSGAPQAEPKVARATYTVVALLLTALFLERSAHYGVRAVLPVWFVGPLELSAAQTLGLRTLSGVISPLAALAAGGLALYIRTDKLLLVGVSLVLLAYLGLITAGSVPLWLCIASIGVGEGLLKPTLYAGVASAVRGHNSNARVMVFLGLTLIANGAGFAGTFVVAAARELSWAWVFGGAAATMALAAVAVGLTHRATAFVPVDSSQPIRRHEVLRALGVLPIYWLWSLTVHLSEAPFNAPYDIPMGVLNLSVLGLVLAALAVAATLALLRADDIQIHEVPWMGSVLIATALFAIPACWPLADHSDTVRYALYYALALSQGVMPALVLSWLTRDLPLRILPLIVAVWMFSGVWTYFGELALSWMLPPGAVLPVVIAVTLTTGLALLRSDANVWSSRP